MLSLGSTLLCFPCIWTPALVRGCETLELCQLRPTSTRSAVNTWSIPIFEVIMRSHAADPEMQMQCFGHVDSYTVGLTEDIAEAFTACICSW